MKIEASGVIFRGLCELKTPKCTAKDQSGPLTAVWTAEGGRRQIDVCGACLRVMTLDGEWDVLGARVMSAA